MSNKLLKNLFSVTNKCVHKCINICGIKICFKSKKLQIRQLEAEIQQRESEKNVFLQQNFNPVGFFDSKLKYAETGMDNVRSCTLELVIRELIRNNVVNGAIAELGVFQGDFAGKISEFLQTNKFYLFDTFSGFNIKDKNIEKEKKYSEIDEDYSNTSEALVLSKITNPQRCVIKKGYFPDSLDGLEEEFIFVSIDADLYEPTIKGLEYFYPRLKSGGYIFLHDFNHSLYRGVKEAFYQYFENNDIKYVPIPDISGSIIIAK